MSSCFLRCNKANVEDEKRDVVLTFSRENLDYSIKNYAYIASHVLNEESECVKHIICDIEEDGNRDRVTRLLGLIHAAVVEMLYPYTKSEVVEETINDDMWEPEQYVVRLHVPNRFSQTTCHLLSRLIHEYMVYRVLYDWLTITGVDNPRLAVHWREKAEEAHAEINEIKNMRTGTLLRPHHPW